MMFVDGENFTIRAQQLANSKGVVLVPGKCYERDTYVWFYEEDGLDTIFPQAVRGLLSHPIRSFYYASAIGDDPRREVIREKLWDLGFHPEVFKRDPQTKRSKGVDIALATDVLANAARSNYDAMVLIGGDGDYVPMVREVKRLGKLVIVGGFAESGLNRELKLAADYYAELGDRFLQTWRGASRSPPDP